MKTIREVLRSEPRRKLVAISMLFHKLEEEIPDFDTENTSIEDLWLQITKVIEFGESNETSTSCYR